MTRATVPLAWRLALLGLGALLVVACGGSSTRTTEPKGDGEASGAAGQAAAGSSMGGANQAGTGNESGAAGMMATGGIITIVSSEPPACQTADGLEGIVVDTFPYPSPAPRCEALNQPGSLDSACPQESQVKCANGECLILPPFDGCCRADGACGLMDTGRFRTVKSLGCFSREPWIENSDWLGGERQAVACNPK